MYCEFKLSEHSSRGIVRTVKNLGHPWALQDMHPEQKGRYGHIMLRVEGAKRDIIIKNLSLHAVYTTVLVPTKYTLITVSQSENLKDAYRLDMCSSYHSKSKF